MSSFFDLTGDDNTSGVSGVSSKICFQATPAQTSSTDSGATVVTAVSRSPFPLVPTIDLTSIPFEDDDDIMERIQYSNTNSASNDSVSDSCTSTIGTSITKGAELDRIPIWCRMGTLKANTIAPSNTSLTIDAHPVYSDPTLLFCEAEEKPGEVGTSNMDKEGGSEPMITPVDVKVREDAGTASSVASSSGDICGTVQYSVACGSSNSSSSSSAEATPLSSTSPTHTGKKFSSVNADAIVANLVSMGFEMTRALNVSVHCSTLDSAVIYLLSNDVKEKEHSRTYLCPVCMDHYDISDMISLSCLHRMCIGCFVGYCSTKINDGEILPTQLACPTLLEDGSNKACGTAITIHEIKSQVPADVFEKYDRFSTRAFCENEKLRCCPKCNEWYIDLSEALDIDELWCKVTCGNCQHPFCGKCGQTPHKLQHDQDISCEDMARWLEENSKADKSLTEYMKEHKLFSCPKCKMAAELSTGCKFLYCRCTATFCALCGKSLTQKDHYAHFQGVEGCSGPFGNGCRGSVPSAAAVKASSSKQIAAAVKPRPPPRAPVKKRKRK